MSDRKLRVAVLYGGRSGEHEVSLQSAASVVRNLDPDRFEIIPIGIDRDGRWHMNDLGLLDADRGKSLPIDNDAPQVVLPPFAQKAGTMLVPSGEWRDEREIDLIFPVMHGPLCEDGSIQGLCELADVPYVGSGVLGSAISMDKDVAKRLVAAAGISVVPYLTIKHDRWERMVSSGNAEELSEWIKANLGYPLFVKPANMGSSVGIHKVASVDALPSALEDAFRYDLKVLVEKGIDAREIELSVLDNPDSGSDPLVSIAGEIAPSHEFYSYNAKYLDENGAALLIPAPLSPEQMEHAQQMAREVYIALECEGMARVDLFLDRNSGAWYFNEVNTVPGFTTISMYPKLWEASGIPYRELLSRLIDLAIARHRRKSGLVREWNPSVTNPSVTPAA